MSKVTLDVDGFAARVDYAGPHPVLPGLDQVNVLLPKSLQGHYSDYNDPGENLSGLQLTVDGVKANPVNLVFR